MSNFLQVPPQRRDSLKRETWDYILRETESTGSSDGQLLCSQTDENGGESDERKVIKPRDSILNKDNFYTTLVRDASHVRSETSDLVTFEEIPWIDQSLIEESMAFHKKYFAHEIISIVAAIFFAFAVKPMSATFLKARKRGVLTAEDVYEQQISTIQKIIKFFNFRKHPDEAYDEILKIRKIHSDASNSDAAAGLSANGNREDLKLDESWKHALVKAIQNDLEFVDTSDAPKDTLSWDPMVPVSQFDMTTQQLGFWVYMWLFPRFFGIKNRAEEMKGIIHVWAIFGRLIGIKDEFNICLVNPEMPPAIPDLYEKLYRNVILESMKTIDTTVITFQSEFIEILRQRLPFITYKAFMYVGLQELDGYKGNNMWTLMTWKDKLCVKLLQAFFSLMRHSYYFRMSVNCILYIWFQLQYFLYLPSKKWRIPIPRYLKNSITLKLY